MILLNIRTSRYEFDQANWSKDMRSHIEKIYYEAATQFTIYTAPEIPVDAGTARGTLRARVKTFHGTITPMDRYINADVDIEPYIKRNKTGWGPDKGAKRSLYIFERQRDGKNFSFKFKTNIEHFIYRDTNVVTTDKNPQKPTPWYAILAGRRAFEKYLSDNLMINMPSIKKYLTTIRTDCLGDRIKEKRIKNA